MAHLTYPSSFFPARPAFSVDLPDGWQPEIAEGSELAAVRPSNTGEFRANIIVQMHRVPGTADIESVAPGFEEAVDALPFVRVLDRQYRDVLGAPGFRIEATFFAPDGATEMYQAMHVACVNHGMWTDIVTFVACATAAQTRDALQEIRAMLDSVERH